MAPAHLDPPSPRRRDLPASATRDDLVRRIRSSPGIRHRELLRATGLAPGTLAHHLRALTKAGTIHRERYHGFSCFFTAEVSPRVRRTAPALRVETAKWVHGRVRDQPGVTAQMLADEKGIHPSSILRHVRRLVEAGLVERRRTRNGLEIFPVDPNADMGARRPD